MDNSMDCAVRDDVNAALSAELEQWRGRFRAILGEDRPDTAGNKAISMAAEVERLRETNARLNRRCQTYEAAIAERVKAQPAGAGLAGRWLMPPRRCPVTDDGRVAFGRGEKGTKP